MQSVAKAASSAAARRTAQIVISDVLDALGSDHRAWRTEEVLSRSGVWRATRSVDFTPPVDKGGYRHYRHYRAGNVAHNVT